MVSEFFHGTPQVGWKFSIDKLREINLNKQESSISKLYPWLDCGDALYVSNEEEMGAGWNLYNFLKNKDLHKGVRELLSNPKLLGYVRIYRIDMKDSNLDILDLSDTSKEENLLRAFAIYIKSNEQYLFRDLDDTTKRVKFESLKDYDESQDRVEKFLNKHLPSDWEKKDLIISYRLDSRYKHALNDFALGFIREDQIVDVMRLGNFGIQYCFRTHKAEDFVNSFGDPFDLTTYDYYHRDSEKIQSEYEKFRSKVLEAKDLYNEIVKKNKMK